MTHPDLALALALASAALGLVPASFLMRAGVDWLPFSDRPGRRLLASGVALVAALAVGVCVVWAWPGSLLAVAAVFCCLVVGWTSLLFIGWELASVGHGRDDPERVDAALVLGAGLLGDRVPPVLASRIDTAIELWRSRTPRPLLVMSGGKGTDEQVSEAFAMAEYAVARGVPRQDVVLEDRSTTTWENLLFSAELLERRLGADARIVVVSNDFHTLRAALMARAQRLRLGFRGAPTVGISRAAAELREFGALVYQWPVPALLVLGVVPLLVTAWLA